VDELLEQAIVNLRGALRAKAWAEPEQSEALVREAREACDEWLARREPAPALSAGIWTTTPTS
jgi:hypothetical protein